MDQKDSSSQSIVKTIMIGSRILAQGVFKGKTPKGTVQIKIGENFMAGNSFHRPQRKMAPNRIAFFYIFKN